MIRFAVRSSWLRSAKMKRVVIWLALVVAVALPAAAQPPKGKGQGKANAEPQVPAGVTYEKDVEFGKGGDTSLHLDIARPEKAEGRLPCIVVIHGGGWRGGNFKLHVP